MPPRRDILPTILFVGSLVAVLVAILLFRVRVALAGGRLVLVLAAIVALVWLLVRAGRSGGGRGD